MAKKSVTIEKLARMVEKGFRQTAAKTDIQRVEKRLDNLEKRFDTLDQGQEEIKLRLDQVAYRFELQDLEKRFEKRLRKVELKLGLRKS